MARRVSLGQEPGDSPPILDIRRDGWPSMSDKPKSLRVRPESGLQSAHRILRRFRRLHLGGNHQGPSDLDATFLDPIGKRQECRLHGIARHRSLFNERYLVALTVA